VAFGKSKGFTRNQKAKGKGQKAKGRHFIFSFDKSGVAFSFPPFPCSICLLILSKAYG
jgi:hypothetical protein